MRRTFLLAIGAWLATAPFARAHDVTLTRVRADLSAEGRFQVDLYYDVDADLAGVAPGHLTDADVARLGAMPESETRQLLLGIKGFTLRRVRLRFDGKAVEPVVEFPRRPASLGTQPSLSLSSSRIIRLTGAIPFGSKSFDFWASRAFGNIVLEIVKPDGGVENQVLERAERSRPYYFGSHGAPESRWAVASKFLKLGFEHIVPDGADHVLFVLGLFLLAAKLKPLLWQVTAFTIAHCITLALSTYGVVRLSPSIVEPLIALSIAFVAIENVCTSKLHAWRPAIVFLFGLLHGLGFAGALEELGLPRDRMVTALASFNVGVELGQISVIGVAMILVGWAWRRPWYRRRVAIPASLVIAAVGLYWAASRSGLLGRF